MTTNAVKGAAKSLDTARHAKASWTVSCEIHILNGNLLTITEIYRTVKGRLGTNQACSSNRPKSLFWSPSQPPIPESTSRRKSPEVYDDPVTLPAGDIAENAYYRRDIRRSYPRLSVVKQADAVGLLTVGSQAKPDEERLRIGDAGKNQLVQIKQEGEEKGLAALFEKDQKAVSSIFGPNGLPPFPVGSSRVSPRGGRKYVLDENRENGYPEG